MFYWGKKNDMSLLVLRVCKLLHSTALYKMPIHKFHFLWLSVSRGLPEICLWIYFLDDSESFKRCRDSFYKSSRKTHTWLISENWQSQRSSEALLQSVLTFIQWYSNQTLCDWRLLICYSALSPEALRFTHWWRCCQIRVVMYNKACLRDN